MTKLRRSNLDEKYLGQEPTITSNSNNSDIIRAYNWYGYFYSIDDAKDFALSYLKSIKHNKQSIKKLQLIAAYKFFNIGWNARILLNGGSLPKPIEKLFWQRLENLIAEPEQIKSDNQVAINVISIQKRIEGYVSRIIGDIEEELDKFYTKGKNDIDFSSWFRERAIKPQIAKKISEYYQPLYAELFDAIKNKDRDLRYAYNHLTRPELKRYLEFIKSILAVASTFTSITKVTRKPRKKKEKPASALVSKLKFKQEDKTFHIMSVKPTDIVGSSQLWVFNTKYRTLTCYNAIGPAGLSVKGSSIVGYDQSSSITKKIRKPEVVLPKLLEGGKLILKSLMDNLNVKPKGANGRINKDVVLLRVTRW